MIIIFVEVVLKFIFYSSITNSLYNVPVIWLCIMVWQLRFTLLEYPSARDLSTFVITAKSLAFWIIFLGIWSVNLTAFSLLSQISCQNQGSKNPLNALTNFNYNKSIDVKLNTISNNEHSAKNSVNLAEVDSNTKPIVRHHFLCHRPCAFFHTPALSSPITVKFF